MIQQGKAFVKREQSSKNLFTGQPCKEVLIHLNKALRYTLLCVIGSSALADQIYLDLPGILKLAFDTLNDVACYEHH